MSDNNTNSSNLDGVARPLKHINHLQIPLIPVGTGGPKEANQVIHSSRENYVGSRQYFNEQEGNQLPNSAKKMV